MTCTTAGCESPSELYLCAACIRDLDAWIAKCHELLPDLDITIARLDNVRVGNVEGGNGTKSAGSAPPLNVDAMQLKININTLTQGAAHYAKDEYAAGIAQTIRTWYTNAELAISGPENDAPTKTDITKAAADIRTQIPEHLTGPDLSLWLKNIHRITVYPFTLRKWAQRGHITRTNTEGRPTYSPAAVLIHARKDILQKQRK